MLHRRVIPEMDLNDCDRSWDGYHASDSGLVGPYALPTMFLSLDLTISSIGYPPHSNVSVFVCFFFVLPSFHALVARSIFFLILIP